MKNLIRIRVTLGKNVVGVVSFPSSHTTRIIKEILYGTDFKEEY